MPLPDPSIHRRGLKERSNPWNCQQIETTKGCNCSLQIVRADGLQQASVSPSMPVETNLPTETSDVDERAEDRRLQILVATELVDWKKRPHCVFCTGGSRGPSGVSYSFFVLKAASNLERFVTILEKWNQSKSQPYTCQELRRCWIKCLWFRFQYCERCLAHCGKCEQGKYDILRHSCPCSFKLAGKVYSINFISFFSWYGMTILFTP